MTNHGGFLPVIFNQTTIGRFRVFHSSDPGASPCRPGWYYQRMIDAVRVSEHGPYETQSAAFDAAHAAIKGDRT